MFLLDTNVISERFKIKCNAGVEKWLDVNESKSFISVVTIEELRYGLLLMPDGKRKIALEKRINSTVHYFNGKILNFEQTEAERCAEFHHLAHKAGFDPGMEDLMIAAIASSFDLVIATRNTKDFEYLPVETIDPFVS